MDDIIQSIVQIVGSLGFPIAACVGMFWYMMKKDEQHKAEIDLLSAAVQNNTLVMTEIRDRLDEIKGKKDV